VESRPASRTIETMVPIWQRLFQKESVGLEENFFDLGGDSRLAADLVHEIAKVFGRELPPVTICRAPTLAALAAFIEQPTLPPFPPLIVLKSGAEEPPVFVTHGLGGSVLELAPFARRIHSRNPILGMQAKGTDGTEKPFERIEDMAQFFLEAIQKIQPQGPYFLAGYSLGGLVTLEIAQRLVAKGEKVALLALLESYPDRRYLSLRQRMRLIKRLVRHHATTLIRLPMSQAFSYFTNPAVRLSYSSQDNGPRPGCHSPISASYAAAGERMRDSGYLALKRYRPRFYCGKIKFVRASISLQFPDNPVTVWGGLANDFEVDTVPGNHSGIITTHFETLASVLSRYLQEALGQK
jgi:acetoacetyl-CoA synthetase